jgi:hypothetical protein
VQKYRLNFSTTKLKGPPTLCKHKYTIHNMFLFSLQWILSFVPPPPPKKKRSYILAIFFNKPSWLLQLFMQDTKHPLKKFGSLLVGTRKIHNALCMQSLFLFTEKYYCLQKRNYFLYM